MTEEKLNKWGFTIDGWGVFLKEMATEFGDGKLISHDWLKEQFGLKEINWEDFDNQFDFQKAVDMQKLAYIPVVEAVTLGLLKQEKMYIDNVRGDGYIVIPAEKQTQFAFDMFQEELKKLIKKTALIMSNVRHVDNEQQAKDNDLRARFAKTMDMLATIKEKPKFVNTSYHENK